MKERKVEEAKMIHEAQRRAAQPRGTLLNPHLPFDDPFGGDAFSIGGPKDT